MVLANYYLKGVLIHLSN